MNEIQEVYRLQVSTGPSINQSPHTLAFLNFVFVRTEGDIYWSTSQSPSPMTNWRLQPTVFYRCRKMSPKRTPTF